LEAVGRHQKDSLDLRVQPRVYAGHLQLVFEIGHGAQTADDDLGADRAGEVHQQRVEGAHFDAVGITVFEMGNLVPYNFYPLIGGKQRPLAVVARDADDQPVDDLERPANDIGMPVGNRVEGAGIDADSRLDHVSPSLDS